jgi:hypothetical protein
VVGVRHDRDSGWRIPLLLPPLIAGIAADGDRQV